MNLPRHTQNYHPHPRSHLTRHPRPQYDDAFSVEEEPESHLQYDRDGTQYSDYQDQEEDEEEEVEQSNRDIYPTTKQSPHTNRKNSNNNHNNSSNHPIPNLSESLQQIPSLSQKKKKRRSQIPLDKRQSNYTPTSASINQPSDFSALSIASSNSLLKYSRATEQPSPFLTISSVPLPNPKGTRSISSPNLSLGYSDYNSNDKDNSFSKPIKSNKPIKSSTTTPTRQSTTSSLMSSSPSVSSSLASTPRSGSKERNSNYNFSHTNSHATGITTGGDDLMLVWSETTKSPPVLFAGATKKSMKRYIYCEIVK